MCVNSVPSTVSPVVPILPSCQWTKVCVCGCVGVCVGVWVCGCVWVCIPPLLYVACSG